MIEIRPGEFVHKDSFAESFEIKQSIVDYIPRDNDTWSDNMTHNDLHRAINYATSKLLTAPQPSVYPNVSGKEFVILLVAGLLANKAVLTHEKMVMGDDTLIVTDDNKHEYTIPTDNVTPSEPYNISSGYALFFTSGSTSKPKLVKTTQLNLITAALGSCNDELDPRKTDLGLFCLPRIHAYEIIMELMFTFTGMKLAFTDIPNLYPSYIRLKPTMMVVVPQILNAFHEKNLPLKLRILISGGAPIREDTWQFYKLTCDIVANGYGATETTASIAISTNNQNIGSLHRGVIVKVSDNNEMLVRGLPVSQDRLDPHDGWYHTHDIVNFENGVIRLVGRSNGIIKLQQGEYINLDKLTAIYSKQYVTVVYASSLDRYPSAIVFVPDEAFPADESAILASLKAIHADNGLNGYERVETIKVRPSKDIILLDNMKIDYESIRRTYSA